MAAIYHKKTPYGKINMLFSLFRLNFSSRRFESTGFSLFLFATLMFYKENKDFFDIENAALKIPAKGHEKFYLTLNLCGSRCICQ